MGNKPSQEDQEHLIVHDEEILPVFEELKLVLIGSQGAGKNTVGNAILGEKIFTVWTSYKRNYVKATRSVSGTQIHLARVPGWNGDLSRSKKTKYEIVHCVQTVYDTGPHAVLLALKVNSVLSESTIHTLESLLTDKLWAHTIVVFTNVEKLGGYTIENYIRCNQLQPLIDKCGQRYFVVKKKDINQITDTIEELIAKKNSASCLKLSLLNEVDTDTSTLLSDWMGLVERIKSKIDSISAFKGKLRSLQETRNDNNVTKLLKSKDEEIKRLINIVKEKEREIERLRNSRTDDGPDLSALYIRIEELKNQLNIKCKEVDEKDTEIGKLKKELQILKTEVMEWRTHEDQRANAHTDMRSQLGQNVSKMKSNDQSPLNYLPSNRGGHVPTRPVLEGWGVRLLQILQELSDDHLKRMKHLMRLSEEWKIPRSSMEDKNRDDLVDLIIEKWGQRQSILKTRDLIKTLPRNDDRMIELFAPFLEKIVLISNIQPGQTQETLKAVLTVQPEPSQIFRGENVTLTCDVQGEGWTYRWQCGGTSHETKEKELKITAEHTQMCACHSCRGSVCSFWSDEVTLTVSDKPRVTVKPQSSVFTGDTVTLSCDAGRSTGRRIIWYKVFQRIKYGSETETLRDVRVSDGGEYRCNVENVNSTTVTLTVIERPKAVVRVHPDGRVFRGEMVTLTCDIQDTDVTRWNYSWNKDHSEIHVSQSQEYRISVVNESHTGHYSCRGRETRGSRHTHTSDEVTLTLSEAPVLSALKLLSFLLAASPYLLVTVIIGVKCSRAYAQSDEIDQYAVTEE